ncbi:MAG: CdiI family contact-dependent growth inhibition immunity protein [Planctomycetota bacterium]|jgi:hypothetical protein|nr:CdiI family contact-dependent growth inhibition immunity protein [Planctomycetota bacterium]
MFPEINSCVSVKRNEDFLVLASLSGACAIFDLAHWHPTDLSNELLGSLACRALDKSYQYTKKLRIDGMPMESNYDEWVRLTKQKFNYKNDRKMFNNMCSCSIIRKKSEIIITIPIHKKLKAWIGVLERKTISDSLRFEEFGSEIRDSIDRAYAEEFS